MAAQNGKPKTQHPTYTVVRVENGQLKEVLEAEVTAPTQQKACDRVADTMKDEKFTLAAFLTNSLKEFDYETERTVSRKAKEKEKPTLLGGKSDPAPPVAAPAA